MSSFHKLKEKVNEAIKLYSEDQYRNLIGPDGKSYYDIIYENRNELIDKVMNCFYSKHYDFKKNIIENSLGKEEIIYVPNIYERIFQKMLEISILDNLENKYFPFSFGGRYDLYEKNFIAECVSSTFKLSNGQISKLKINFNQNLDNLVLKNLREEFNIDNDILDLIKIRLRLHINNRVSFINNLRINAILHDLDKMVSDKNDFNEVMKNGTEKSKKRPYDRFYTRTKYTKNGEQNYRKSAKGRLQIRIIRYLDEIILISANKYDMEKLIELFKHFNKNKNLKYKFFPIRNTKNEFKIDLLSYTYRKTENDNIRISIRNKPGLYKFIKKKINYYIRNGKFERLNIVLINLIIKYNICTNISEFIRDINKLLYKFSRNGVFKKVKNKDIFIRNHLYFDLWNWRTFSSTSIKEYRVNIIHWKDRNLFFKNKRYQYHKIESIFKSNKFISDNKLFYRSFANILLFKKYKDPIDNKNLCFERNFNIHVHHLKPKYIKEINYLDNLILVSKKNHKLIHSKNETQNKNLISIRKKLTS